LSVPFSAASSRRHHWRPRQLSPEALALLQEQPWKGNVRELRNVVERVLILSDADPISPADVRAALPGAGAAASVGGGGAAGAGVSVRGGGIPADGPLRDIVDSYEREVIRERLRAHGGHVTNAARSLGLERSHLYKKCRQLGIDIREEG
jgi:two-component system, NtrC family, nitrogen regulation response regulator NtrX